MGTAGRKPPSESSDARSATQVNDRLKHEHKNPQRRMCGMCKPRRQETQCCVPETTRGVKKTITFPQSERTTQGTDTEIHQDTLAITSTSTAHTPTTDIRDTDQPEHGNDESENPGEWRLVKRSRMKASPLIQSKRPREMPTILEHMESDELQRMATGSNANKREGLPAKGAEEVRMDPGPQDAGVTEARMDEMLMDQIKWDFTRLCEGGNVRASDNQRSARRSRQNRARAMKDPDYMNVLEWARESIVPKDAKILVCGWALKMKCPSKVRARVGLKRQRSDKTRRSVRTDTHDHGWKSAVPT